MNNIVLSGRVTADLELKTTQNGVEVTSFSVASKRDYAKAGEEAECDFINCVAWRQTAVFAAKHFRKGDGILLKGSLQSRKYTDKEGNTRNAYEVVVDNVDFPLGKKQSSDENSKPTKTTTKVSKPQNAEAILDDDLPF